MKKLFSILFLALLLTSCGDPVVDLNEITYQPKIVVNGFLYPNEPVRNIFLMRNFDLGINIDSSSFYISPEENFVEAAINNIMLEYDPVTQSYFTDALEVEYNTLYELNVSATIDGVELAAVSVTVTPQIGFDLIENELGTFIYREEIPNIKFIPSPGTGFYAFSIRADSADFDHYIYENPYLPNVTQEELEENFNRVIYQSSLLLNVNSYSAEPIEFLVQTFDTWFYSSYKAIVYAGDDNFKDYFLTAGRTQQFDGNFVEPEFHFEGEGIGVFGSAIRDTVTFTIIPNVQ